MKRLRARMKRGLEELGHWIKRPFKSRRPATATPPVGSTQDIAQSEKSVPVPEPGDDQPKLVRDNAPLENFPAEIRHQLLSNLDFQGLRALISVSPVYLQQYLLDRKHLLTELCEKTLGSVTIDACAVYESGLVDFSKTRTPKSVTRLLQSYKNRDLSLKDAFNINDIMSIMSFHTSIIMPLARHYIGWAFNNLAKETKKDPLQSYNEPLSRAEETRLVRALYRFQLYCNLFGVGHDHWQRSRWNDDEDKNIFKIFLGIYESWEVEEIACVYAFATIKIGQIFYAIRWDVNEDNPKFEGQRPPTPEGTFDLENCCQFYPFSCSIISTLLTTYFNGRDEGLFAMGNGLLWP